MKTRLLSAALALAIITLFISCDNGTGSKSITGTWLLKKTVYAGTDNLGVPYSSEVNQELIDAEILVLTESEYTKYWYDEDRYNYVYTDTDIMNLTGSSFTIYTSSTYTYSFSNGQLVLTRTYDSGSSTSYHYDVYNGNIPLPEWTASSNIDQNYVSATHINVGTTDNQSLTDSDIDWFSFDAEAGSTYTITTNGGVEDTDTVLVLYDTDGTTYLNRNDDYADGSFSSQIVWDCPSTGTYYFKVRGFSEGETGDYSISVTQ